MTRSGRPIFIAHRAANSTATMDVARHLVDLCELDVHLGPSATIEVRHAKRLWPTRRLWERWYLLARRTPVPVLTDIVTGQQPEPLFWFDLKGVTPRLARTLRPFVMPTPRVPTDRVPTDDVPTGRRADGGVAAERPPTMLSSKSWWLLAPFAGVAGLRTLRSAGNRLELALMRWLPGRVQLDGAVVHRRLLDERTIARLHRQGLLFTWGVTEGDDLAELVADGRIDGFILDDPTLAAPYR